MEKDDVKKRLDTLAAQYLSDQPDMLRAFRDWKTQLVFEPVLFHGLVIGSASPFFDTGLLDQYLLGEIGRWSDAWYAADQAKLAKMDKWRPSEKVFKKFRLEQRKKSKAERNRHFYEMVVKAGLELPKNSHGTLPRGINELANVAGFSRQTFAAGVKAHMALLEESKNKGRNG